MPTIFEQQNRAARIEFPRRAKGRLQQREAAAQHYAGRFAAASVSPSRPASSARCAPLDGIRETMRDRSRLGGSRPDLESGGDHRPVERDGQRRRCHR